MVFSDIAKLLLKVVLTHKGDVNISEFLCIIVTPYIYGKFIAIIILREIITTTKFKKIAQYFLCQSW